MKKVIFAVFGILLLSAPANAADRGSAVKAEFGGDTNCGEGWYLFAKNEVVYKASKIPVWDYVRQEYFCIDLKGLCEDLDTGTRGGGAKMVLAGQKEKSGDAAGKQWKIVQGMKTVGSTGTPISVGFACEKYKPVPSAPAPSTALCNVRIPAARNKTCSGNSKYLAVRITGDGRTRWNEDVSDYGCLTREQLCGTCNKAFKAIDWVYEGSESENNKRCAGGEICAIDNVTWFTKMKYNKDEKKCMPDNGQDTPTPNPETPDCGITKNLLINGRPKPGVVSNGLGKENGKDCNLYRCGDNYTQEGDNCVEKRNPLPNPTPSQAIVNALAALKGLGDPKDKNWLQKAFTKEEGGTNVKRILIDSAGATVVGVGAGLLTNKLVRDAQLKSGYEAIQCVAPNATASFGEVFLVR